MRFANRKPETKVKERNEETFEERITMSLPEHLQLLLHLTEN